MGVLERLRKLGRRFRVRRKKDISKCLSIEHQKFERKLVVQRALKEKIDPWKQKLKRKTSNRILMVKKLF